MNLLSQLDEIEPRWRQVYSPDPMEAAYQLGLLDDPDDSYSPDYKEIDLENEREAWERYVTGYEVEE